VAAIKSYPQREINNANRKFVEQHGTAELAPTTGLGSTWGARREQHCVLWNAVRLSTMFEFPLTAQGANLQGIRDFLLVRLFFMACWFRFATCVSVVDQFLEQRVFVRSAGLVARLRSFEQE
jgi:hypothetical protein